MSWHSSDAPLEDGCPDLPFESRILQEFLNGLPLLAWMTDASGTPVFANPAFLDFTGVSSGEEADVALIELVYAEDRAGLERILNDTLRKRRSFATEFQFRRTDGQYRWMSCVTTPYPAEEGTCLGLVALCTDLTERKQREEQLSYMAAHDSLTGLPNRRMFESSLARSVARAQRGAESVLLMLDIDNLKSYNDALGHLEGDQALINFSLLLQRHVRAGDLLARIGGDEFAVLLEQTSVPEAVDIAERMRAAAAEEEFVAHARAHELGLSAGLVPIDGSLAARQVFDLADEAMYEAKEQGRNRVLVMRPGERAQNGSGERLARRLQEALAEGRFVLEFQPVFRLDDGTVVYYESLARIREEGGRLLRPADFLPAAERLGLMPRVTRTVLSLAIDALATHSSATVSVNLSRGDLADELLPEYIEGALSGGRIEPRRLIFEVSEGVVAGNLTVVRDWLDRLGPSGGRFVLDEFGAGLGLLGLLRELPFEQVKLDGSITAALTVDGENTAYVEAVRALIESQGHVAVAAWVEDAESLGRVRSAGFAYAQGFHLQVPSSDLGALVRALG